MNQSISRRPIRKQGAAPIFVQLAEIIETDLLDGSGIHAALPSEAALSRQFDVSRVTIRQALKQLETRGKIYSERGKGYFKSSPRIQGLSGFHSFSDEVRRMGGVPGSEVIGFDADTDLPLEFVAQLEPGDSHDERFVRLSRTRSIDGKAVALEHAYLPADLFPDADRSFFEDTSLYNAMAERWGIVPAWADALFEPVAASPEEAAILNVAPGAPLMVVWRVTSSENDQVVEYVKSIYRGDGFKLNVARFRL